MPRDGGLIRTLACDGNSCDRINCEKGELDGGSAELVGCIRNTEDLVQICALCGSVFQITVGDQGLGDRTTFTLCC